MLGAAEPKTPKPAPVDPSTLVKPVSSMTTIVVVVASVALIGLAAYIYTRSGKGK